MCGVHRQCYIQTLPLLGNTNVLVYRSIIFFSLKYKQPELSGCTYKVALQCVLSKKQKNYLMRVCCFICNVSLYTDLFLLSLHKG